MKPRRSESGIALVTAILVVALAAIASAAILSSANIAIRRTTNFQESEVAWWYASGVESWVKSILERDAEDNRLDALNDSWAKPVDYLPVDEGYVRGLVVDLQGRFNLNNLATPRRENYERQLTVFVRLLVNADIADELQARAIASAIRDWCDSDIEPTGFDGAEDSDYLGIDPPYRVPNRMMASVSELLAVKGITRETYRKLAPLLAALPRFDVPINVNTAPEAVLAALATQPRAELAAFVRERTDQPAESVDELFNARAAFTAEDADPSLMSVDSSFFMLQSEVYIGSGVVRLYSFYFRPRSGAPAVYGRSTDTP